jgi:NAD(P)H dehydrogenase (quinone)
MAGDEARAASRDGQLKLLVVCASREAEAQGARVGPRRISGLVSAEVMDLGPGWRESAARMNAAYSAPSLDAIHWAIAFGEPARFRDVPEAAKAASAGRG